MGKTAKLHPAAERYAKHINPSFIKLLGVFGYGRVFTRASDVWLWDHEGRKYLDFLAGFGCVSIGHNHPRLVARLKTLLDADVPHFLRYAPSIEAANLAEALALLLPDPLEVTLFSNSGSEGVDAGMKLARAATGRTGFVYCAHAYHGANLGNLAVIGDKAMREPFEPLLQGCVQVPFCDLGALRAALKTRSIAALLLEPIQCEGGMHIPPAGYLREAQELCRKYGTLLLLDEVQTGLGRTGSLFAFEREGFVPDILVLAKGLSGGIAPIAATITSEALFRKAYGTMARQSLHASTYAGNAMGCVAALETIRILREDKLVANSEARGKQLVEGLRARLAGHPLVRHIRGRGLLAAIELGPTDRGLVNKLAPKMVELVSRQVFGQWASLKLMEEGIVCQPTSEQWDVLKLTPPLTIGAAEVDQMVDTLGGILDQYTNLGKLLLDVTRRLSKQARSGFSW